MVTDPMVSIFDSKFDSLNTSCGKVSDEISFSKSSDFRDKPVSSVFIDTASKVREEKQKSKVMWDSSTDSVKRGVEIFRSRILKHIDDMEEKLMLEVNRTELIQFKRYIS
jgi:hypothetical protein